jgi:hypothetical protein
MRHKTHPQRSAADLHRARQGALSGRVLTMSDRPAAKKVRCRRRLAIELAPRAGRIRIMFVAMRRGGLHRPDGVSRAHRRIDRPLRTDDPPSTERPYRVVTRRQTQDGSVECSVSLRGVQEVTASYSETGCPNAAPLPCPHHRQRLPCNGPHCRIRQTAGGSVRRRQAAGLARSVKSMSAVVTTPAVRPGAWWYFQYRLVWAITWSGGGAPYAERSSVVWASPTSIAS